MWLYRRIMIAVGIAAVLSVLLAACSIENAATLMTGPTVHMGSNNFLVSQITVPKGQGLNLKDDATDEHIITNGSWDGTVQKPHREPSAPAVNVTVTGNSSQYIGPFPTAGTFHIYCTIHQGMNLKVIVQ